MLTPFKIRSQIEVANHLLNVVYSHRHDGTWLGSVPSIPAVVVTSETLAGVKVDLLGALDDYLGGDDE